MSQMFVSIAGRLVGPDERLSAHQDSVYRDLGRFIANEAHHAAGHVIEMVAVERPV